LSLYFSANIRKCFHVESAKVCKFVYLVT
jgi:hypothetical protein